MMIFPVAAAADMGDIETLFPDGKVTSYRVTRAPVPTYVNTARVSSPVSTESEAGKITAICYPQYNIIYNIYNIICSVISFCQYFTHHIFKIRRLYRLSIKIDFCGMEVGAPS